MVQLPCRNPWCKQSFDVHPDEEEFLRKMTFTFGATKIHLPLPVYCPDCRLKIRTCHRNEWHFYRRTATLTGKEMISIYDEKPLWGSKDAVYTHDEWNDDRRDFIEHGRPYDFSQPFFPQFAALHKAVPRLGSMLMGNENCDYTAGTGYCKDCYLINSSEYCERCYYGKLFQSSRDSVDCSYLYNSELCYECLSVFKSYGLDFVAFAQNCRDCSFSWNLSGCSNCCLCSNLRQKQYYFLNEPLSKEEYERRIAEFRGSASATEAMRKRWMQLFAKMIHRSANIVSSERCTGDFIENSKDCIDCYDMNESQDCRNVIVGVQVKDCYDCSNMYIKPELCYDTLGTLEVYHCVYCLFIFHCRDLLYCEYCYFCKDCFGCVGLKRKQYCVFNVQYTKEEYESLVPRIVEHMKGTGEWGLYFPPSLSPFGYNESLAYEYLPLTKEGAQARGFYWRDIEEKKLTVSKTISADTLPDRIEDVHDDVVDWAILCERTGRPFRILKQELDFYRRQKIPVPRLHPDERYDRRLALRNPRKLWKRACMKCQKEIQTTYAPDRPEIVYCEECYLKEVY
ncbi:MAG: hypothetical protein PHN33_04645 [Candidatus Peribacteraceae bacterium]|nr:hypothetical protein [Candidatus Peribacteraceae bacterium]